MSFEIYTPVHRNQVKVGHCSLNGSHNLTVHRADLVAARITKHAVVLIDPASRRIALRAPRTDAAEPAIGVKWSKNGGTAHVQIRGALSAIGCEQVKGLFDLVRKDDLLIVNLPAETSATSTKPARGRGRS